MLMREAARPQKITFAEMRAAGVRDVLIYCSDYTCSHWTRLDGCHWADDVRLSDIDGAFVCTACGKEEQWAARRWFRGVQPSWATF